MGLDVLLAASTSFTLGLIDPEALNGTKMGLRCGAQVARQPNQGVVG